VHNPTFRKPRRILLVTLLIAVLGFVSWLLLRPDPEPTYQGKPLSYWLDGIGNGRTLEATEAVRELGTNAIPTLLRLLKSRDSRLKLLLIQLGSKQNVIHLKWKTAQSRRFEAQFAFTCLGVQGRSAVPDLIEIYRQSSPDPYNDNRRVVADISALVGPAASNAVPLLVRDSTDTNDLIRLSSVQALGYIHANPNLVVPLLTRSLRDPFEFVRESAASGLGPFGTNAQSAVPDLIHTLADPSIRVRGSAATALRKIDPAAAKASITNDSASQNMWIWVYPAN